LNTPSGCPSLSYTLKDITSGSEATIDSSVFTFTGSSALTILTTDHAKINSYIFKATAT
jgi:hypothetical protein